MKGFGVSVVAGVSEEGKKRVHGRDGTWREGGI